MLAAQRRGEDVETSKKCEYGAARDPRDGRAAAVLLLIAHAGEVPWLRRLTWGSSLKCPVSRLVRIVKLFPALL